MWCRGFPWIPGPASLPPPPRTAETPRGRRPARGGDGSDPGPASSSLPFVFLWLWPSQVLPEFKPEAGSIRWVVPIIEAQGSLEGQQGAVMLGEGTQRSVLILTPQAATCPLQKPCGNRYFLRWPPLSWHRAENWTPHPTPSFPLVCHL